LAAVQAGEARARGGGVERGVEVGGGDARGLKLVDLILHQRDQRRDDDGEPGAVQRGQLETHRLAAAGRKEGEDVPTGEGGLDDLTLERAESVVAENGVEC